MLSTMTVALVCTGLLGVLLFGLGFLVSSRRSDQVIGFPDDPADPLHKAVRAHGNTAEYAPMLAILMIAAASNDPAGWVLWVMVVATLARFLIAVGLLRGSLDKANPLRFVGALGTYAAGLVLAVVVVLGL